MGRPEDRTQDTLRKRSDIPHSARLPAAAGRVSALQIPHCVVLLSGGLDSATTAAIAVERGFAVHAITFLYGQRHAIERQAAQRVAASLRLAEHVVYPIDLRIFGGSALTADMEVPKPAKPAAGEPAWRASMGGERGIPITYVPARNTIFLSIALAWAEVLGAGDIFIGVNAVDYSGYPDCRPEFIAAFQRLANLATRAGVEGGGASPIDDSVGLRIADCGLRIADRGRLFNPQSEIINPQFRPSEGDAFRIHAPLINLSKADIIREGTRLGVNFALTHSCYDPDAAGRACGRCESCLLRLEGFHRAGLTDPIPYP